MIIVIEGPDGVGKTSVAQALQALLPLSHLIKLSGAPRGVDKCSYMENVHKSLLPFFEAVADQQHVIMDRFTTSERVYGPLCNAYYSTYLDEYETEIVFRFRVNQIILDASIDTLLSRLDCKRKLSSNEEHPDSSFIERLRNGYMHEEALRSKFNTVAFDTENTPPTLSATRIAQWLNILPKKKETEYSKERPNA